MRLWTLHPRYLDPPGLVTLWREAHPMFDVGAGPGGPWERGVAG